MLERARLERVDRGVLVKDYQGVLFIGLGTGGWSQEPVHFGAGTHRDGP